MVQINDMDDLSRLACIMKKVVNVKRNCDCCGRVVCNGCDAASNDDGTKKNHAKCRKEKYSEESICRSSSTFYDRPTEKQCVRSIAKNCKKSTVECTRTKRCTRDRRVAGTDRTREKRCVRSIAKSCKKSTIERGRIKNCVSDRVSEEVAGDVCRNDEDIEGCKDVRRIKCNVSSLSSSRSTNFNDNDVCKDLPSKETIIDCKDTCPFNNSRVKFDYLELEDPDVCLRIPSIIKHIEQCKENFLEIIKASLIDIGKSNEPEKIISSTLRSARAKELECLLREKKLRNSNICEDSSSSRNEFKFVKNFCRNDLLTAAWKEFEKCHGSFEPKICGPCGVENAVPCVEMNGTSKSEVCGPCGVENAVPCVEMNGMSKSGVCGSCGVENAVPCVEMNGASKSKVCGPCGVENVVPCAEENDTFNELKTGRVYKDEEIGDFVKLIDLKLREELTRNLRKNLCCDDSVELKNSYYCVATLCPCMTKNYSLKGPLILGPFNFGPRDERIDACRKESEDKSESICGSLDTLESFHYSHCILDGDCDDSINSSDVSTGSSICPALDECNRGEPTTTCCNVSSPRCRRREPIVLDHSCSYVSCPDKRAREHLEKSYTKKSEVVAKWGKCHGVLNSTSFKGEEGTRICEEIGLDEEKELERKESSEVVCRREEYGDYGDYLFTRVCGFDEMCASKSHVCKREGDDVCDNICSRPSHICRAGSDGVCITGDDFDNLERFENIGRCGFAKLCRKLFKWVHCVSKNWNEIRSHPYVVVHLPSLSFTDEFRRRARKTFDYLQNIQVGRIGWLDDSNVQVIYVFPTPQSEELLTILKDLITSVRPDIDISKRLWMLRPEPKCILKDCVSGSANLFFSSEVYRRVRHLTAGRHAFILPGVIDQKNIFIACELQIPMMGLPLQFQKRLLKKSYVMQLLDINKVQHPPFLHIHSFGQLCRGMAVMVIEYPMYKTWFVKIDNGFNGHQTAIIRFKKGILGSAIRNIERTCTINEDYLCKLLAETLPMEMQVQKSIYKSEKEFFHDLELYGGIIQACPNNYYDVLSIGVFIEHDLAKPIVITAAEVIHYGADIRNDMAYFLPQNKILQGELDKLVEKVGIILQNEHVVGYFGIDVVTFQDQFDVQQFWVVDVDPYYTDLIAFSDWIKFCVGPSKDDKKSYFQRNNIGNESKVKNLVELLNKTNRHAICCAKLFGTGLSKYCGSTLINLCKQNQIYYDNKEKIGCMVYPTDSYNRAISIVSINSTRLMTMKKFIEALKVINQLSLSINVGETFADTIELCRNFKAMEQSQK